MAAIWRLSKPFAFKSTAAFASLPSNDPAVREFSSETPMRTTEATATTTTSEMKPAASQPAAAPPSLKAWRVACAARRPSEAGPAGRDAAAAEAE